MVCTFAGLGLPTRLIVAAANMQKQAAQKHQEEAVTKPTPHGLFSTGEKACLTADAEQPADKPQIHLAWANFGDPCVRAPLRTNVFGSAKSVRVTKRRRGASDKYRLTEQEINLAG